MPSPISDPWGVILVGVFVSLVLLGIIIMQVYTYVSRYPKDRMWLKLLIWGVFFLDVLSSIFAIWWMYYLFVDNWGSIEAFTVGDWLLAADPMVAGIMAGMVQSFFAWRIRVITGSRLLSLAIYLMAFITTCAGIGTGIAVLWVQSYARFAEFRQIACIWLVSGVIGDISISIALTYHLQKRKGGFASTNRLLDHIIRLTIQNGALTALIAITDMIMYLSTEKPYHIALSFLMPKLYSNTILSSLNARSTRLARGEADHGLGKTDVINSNAISAGRTVPTEIRFGRATDLSALETNMHRPEVFVNVETHEMADVTAKDGYGWDSPEPDTEETRGAPVDQKHHASTDDGRDAYGWDESPEATRGGEGQFDSGGSRV